MVVDSSVLSTNNIKTNDIVSYGDKLCLVAYKEDYSFPYLIINLGTGEVLDAYLSLENVGLSCKFVCSSSDVKLVRL